MTFAVALVLVVVGLIVGFVSGLIGIGGGVLMVPFLYFLYAHPGLSGVIVRPEVQATVAHATSLLVIVPTAIRGTLSYHQIGMVAWRAALPIAVASLAAASIGALAATYLPGPALRAAFGALLIASGAQLFWRRGPVERTGTLRLSLPLMLLTGLVIGFLSATLGVGGGFVAIPLLVYLLGLDLHRAPATSLAVVAFAASAGVITYMLSGHGVEGLPAGSTGYVHWAAAGPLMVGAFISVPWGVEVNRRMHNRRLQAIFSVVFAAIGLWLIVQNLPRAF